MKILSSKAHGMLDYLSVATLMALPRVLHCSPNVTRLLTSAAIGTLGYSLVTRYEMSVMKALPFPIHLTLDGLSGTLLCVSPFILRGEKAEVNRMLVGLGLFEISAALATNSSEPV